MIMTTGAGVLLSSFVVLLISSLSLFAPEIDDDWGERVSSDAVEDWADSLFTSNYEDNGFVGGVISVVRDGEVAFQEGYGYANYFEGIEAHPRSTPFRSGSTSKVFTAIAVMQLVEEGTVDLDDNVNDHLLRTDLDQRLGGVTVRHLLTHTAGYDERFRNTLVRDVEEELASEQYLKEMRHKQIAPSGRRIQYSNYGMGMLGVLIEDISGLSYREYLRRNILKPLGMEDTYIETPSDLTHDSIAVEHRLTGDGGIQPHPFYYKAPAFLGSGGLFFTANDMATFMNAVLGKSEVLLDKGSWNEMLSVQESANPYTGVGYGFWIYERSGPDGRADGNEATIIGHSGGTETFRSKMLLFPEERIGIFVALVGAPSRTFAGSPGLTPHIVTDSFIESFRGRRDLREQEADIEFLKQFEGNYFSTRRAWAGEEAFRDALIYESLEVSIRDGSLVVDGFGSLSLFESSHRELEWISGRSFRLEDTGEIISFSEDGAYMNRAVYTNYDHVGLLRTPKALFSALAVLSLILLSSFVLLFANRKSEGILFEVLSVPAAIIAIATSLFQLMMFGLFRVHFRLESSVFVVHSVLGWLVLAFTAMLLFLLVRDFNRYEIAFWSPRMVHRMLICVALLALSIVFVAYDVVRIA